MLVHPGYFFDFPARVVPRSSACCRPGARSRRASRASSAASIATRPAMTADRRAGARACSFRCFPVRPRRAGASATSAMSRPMTAWLAAAGQRVLQLLPLNEMASGRAVAVLGAERDGDRPDLHPRDRRARVRGARRRGVARRRRSRELEQRRGRRRASTTPPFARLKEQRARSAAFEQFLDAEWRHDTTRARALTRVRRERGAGGSTTTRCSARCTSAKRHRPWTEWPTPLRRREPARSPRHAASWRARCCSASTCSGSPTASGARARAAARANGVELFGDLPFMVDGDSADVWAHQSDFRLDASVGVPPDAFSATGQDWGMPAYRWDAIAAERISAGCAIARGAAPRCTTATGSIISSASIARTRGRGTAASRRSRRPPKPEQLQLGERMLAVFREPGAEIVAEDLGVVPDFVRASLARLGVPGFRVFRWERALEDRAASRSAIRPTIRHSRWRRPARTTPNRMAVWWEEAPRRRAQHGRGASDRSAALAARSRLDRGAVHARPCATRCSKRCSRRDRALLLLPIQDVFGWRDRINEPATVTPENWTFRLPWPSDRLDDAAEARERQRHAARVGAEIRALARSQVLGPGSESTSSRLERLRPRLHAGRRRRSLRIVHANHHRRRRAPLACRRIRVIHVDAGIARPAPASARARPGCSATTPPARRAPST